jgi:hypothetical protein
MDNQNDMKKFVENLVQQLQQQGIKITGAALLNLGDNSEGKPKMDPPFNGTSVAPGFIDREKMIKALEGMKSMGFPMPKGFMEGQIPSEDSEGKQKCFCPNCYSYETFEDTHREEGSMFDYGELKLNGFIFKVKYHQGADGQENLIIKKDTTTDLSSLDLNELQSELTEAVQDKDFVYSQQILNEIQQRKNKS